MIFFFPWVWTLCKKSFITLLSLLPPFVCCTYALYTYIYISATTCSQPLMRSPSASLANTVFFRVFFLKLIFCFGLSWLSVSHLFVIQCLGHNSARCCTAFYRLACISGFRFLFKRHPFGHSFVKDHFPASSFESFPHFTFTFCFLDFAWHLSPPTFASAFFPFPFGLAQIILCTACLLVSSSFCLPLRFRSFFLFCFFFAPRLARLHYKWYILNLEQHVRGNLFNLRKGHVGPLWERSL